MISEIRPNLTSKGDFNEKVVRLLNLPGIFIDSLGLEAKRYHDAAINFASLCLIVK